MADRLEISEVIDRPARDIFAFLNVPENHTRFVPGMLEFKQTSPGAFGRVGATVRGVRRFLGRRLELPYQVTEYDANHKLGLKAAIGPVPFEDGYELDALGGRTRITFWLKFKLSGLIQLARPLLNIWGRLHGRETIDNLKKIMETSG